jgi:hypothetical protein
MAVPIRSSLDDMLAALAADAVIQDVLPPLRYTSARKYRASRGGWQPDSQGGIRFDPEGLEVRATFCPGKPGGQWREPHQPLSRPLRGRAGRSIRRGHTR